MANSNNKKNKNNNVDRAKRRLKRFATKAEQTVKQAASQGERRLKRFATEAEQTVKKATPQGERRLKRFATKEEQTVKKVTPQGERRLKRFATEEEQTVKQAAKDVESTAKKTASSARTAVKDTVAKVKTAGKHMAEKLKQLSSQGRPGSSTKAPVKAVTDASKPSLGSKAMSGLKGGVKWGGLVTAGALAVDIAQQYAHGGWAQVKAAMPAMIASYGSSAVATALGSALGSLISPGVGTVVGAGAGMATNAIVNYLMEGQPEQVKQEVARSVAQQGGVAQQQPRPIQQQSQQAPRMVSEGSTNIGQPVAQQGGVAASDIQQIIIEEANRAGVNPALMLAIANQESGFNPNAVGDKEKGGSYGLFQIHKPSHPDYTGGFDPRANAAYASKMMAGLLKTYNGDVAKALWGYNAGSGNVARGIYPDSTKAYVKNVMANIGRFGNVVPRGQGNDTLATIQNQPLTGQVQANVSAAGTTPQQQGYPIAYNPSTGQVTGGAGSINDYAAALNSFVQNQKSNNAELVKEGMTLNKDALDEQRRFREEAREGTYTPKEAAALYLDYVKQQSQNQPQQVPYDIDIDGYWRAVARDSAYASAGVKTNYAEQYLNNAKMAQMLQQAKLTGVSPDMLGQQSEAQMAREKLIADLAGKAMQYGGAQDMGTYAKNISDLAGNNIDLYTELLKSNNGNVQKAMEQLTTIQNRLLQNQQETYNTNINSQTDLTKTGMQGVNAANTAKIQGEYNLQGERMKLDDPYNQFKAVTSGAQALQYDPAAASKFIQGINPRILGNVAPGFDPNSFGGLNPQEATPVGTPVQSDGGFGGKFYDILKESQRKRGSF